LSGFYVEGDETEIGMENEKGLSLSGAQTQARLKRR